MSERTKELRKKREKGIRLAWEREQELVRKGKATRDWTQEQQKDILDPRRGKAYDEKGRAFEGQHMKSVNQYPEYADNPDNIQFLTKDEHLEAHKGSWNNPSNWRYDPATKVYHDFGEDELIPCEIIDLSDPIVAAILAEQTERKAEEGRTAEEKKATQLDSPEPNDIGSKPTKERTANNSAGIESTPKPSNAAKVPKSENRFIKVLKDVGRFIVEHPAESIEIAGVVAVGLAQKISSIRGQDNRANSDISAPDLSTRLSSDVPGKSDMETTIANIVEKANRSSPHEHEVPRHKQRYHTKDGIVWKDKDPYSRGRKKD